MTARLLFILVMFMSSKASGEFKKCAPCGHLLISISRWEERGENLKVGKGGDLRSSQRFVEKHARVGWGGVDALTSFERITSAR